MNFVWCLLIGLIAGWLAGLISKRSRLGLAGDLAVGVIGGILGGFLFVLLGQMFLYGLTVEGFLLGSLVTATVGAIALLFLLRKVRSS